MELSVFHLYTEYALFQFPRTTNQIAPQPCTIRIRKRKILYLGRKYKLVPSMWEAFFSVIQTSDSLRRMGGINILHLLFSD